jgi:hypothetical protein
VNTGDVERMARQLHDLLRMRGPMALVCDLEALNPTAITPMLRWTLANEADKLAAAGAFVAEAIILRNSLLRGLYRAYTWNRQRLDYPSETFADLADARPWLLSHLEKRGQSLPAGV